MQTFTKSFAKQHNGGYDHLASNPSPWLITDHFDLAITPLTLSRAEFYVDLSHWRSDSDIWKEGRYFKNLSIRVGGALLYSSAEVKWFLNPSATPGWPGYDAIFTRDRFEYFKHKLISSEVAKSLLKGGQIQIDFDYDYKTTSYQYPSGDDVPHYFKVPGNLVWKHESIIDTWPETAPIWGYPMVYPEGHRRVGLVSAYPSGSRRDVISIKGKG